MVLETQRANVHHCTPAWWLYLLLNDLNRFFNVKRGTWGNGANSPRRENESFQRETNNSQFKCIRDQAVPPHMQIDANEMQMAQSKPGFASTLCQASQRGGSARSGLCQKLTSGAWQSEYSLHLLQEAPPTTAPSLPVLQHYTLKGRGWVSFIPSLP